MKNKFYFGTVGSPISTPKKPGGSAGAIEQIRSLGLDALELGWVQSVRVTPQTCELIKTTSEQHNVKISVHAPYFINLNADEVEWPKSRQRLMDAAYYGFLAGASDIIFHPGSYFGKSPEEVLPGAILRLMDCTEELKSKSISITLRPETMGKSAMLGSFSDVLRMSQEVPGIEPCLDFAHLHARTGDGSINSYEEWCSLLNDYAQVLGPVSLKRLHIHLSGIEYSLKGEKNHLPLRESDFNLHALLQALSDLDCSGRILCESPVMEEDALLIKQTLENL